MGDRLTTFFAHIACTMLGHCYFVIRHFTAESRKVGCERCGKCWGMHDGVRAFVPWDSELESMHSGEPRHDQ